MLVNEKISKEVFKEFEEFVRVAVIILSVLTVNGVVPLIEMVPNFKPPLVVPPSVKVGVAGVAVPRVRLVAVNGALILTPSVQFPYIKNDEILLLPGKALFFSTSMPKNPSPVPSHPPPTMA